MTNLTSQIVPLALVLAITSGTAFAKPSKHEPIQLTAAGAQALAQYDGMLESIRVILKPRLPSIDATKVAALMEPYGKKKVSADACMEAAKPILTDINPFLTSATLDTGLIKGAVIANATPRGLAEFTQQGANEKMLVDELLNDPALMKEMLLAGGAKAGRYGKSMQIFREIQSKHPRAKEGILRKLALAIALELAAPELCAYQNIDPLTRYAFYETSYLEKELTPHFDHFTTWLLRQVVNDPQSEPDMLWMREMLWNYRPDQITAPADYNAHYVGLMYSEFGHKRPEFDESLPTTRVQQTIDRGGQCGPKAYFGRCLGRSFGVPVWGARLRSHTAMTYWTPNGWETILGVSFKNGFWTSDQAEPMRGTYFLNIAKAREYPDAFIKACRADWVSSILGEDKVKGMEPDQPAGIWSMLAVNLRRAIVAAHEPPSTKPDPQAPKPPKIQGYPERLVRLQAPAELKKISIDAHGAIEIPAVACSSPSTSTDKIVFMKTRDGGMNLHYKRWELPEPFTYQVDVPKAGNYALSADVVTVNRDQFLLLSVNDQKEPTRMEMPYTIGKWGQSTPVKVTLTKGKNTLNFTRSIPADLDFIKEGYKFAGPEFGGITMKAFHLKPLE